MHDVTRILGSIEGDPSAAEQLLPLVYDELRKLAAQRLALEQPGQTLQATALVHEVYIRLAGCQTKRPWDSRGHFFAAAAEAMRRILVENARHKAAAKHGGDFTRIELLDLPGRTDGESFDLIALDDAIKKLEAEHPEKAQVVKLKFFAGCSLEETADNLGISRATAQRHWTYARAWLFGQLDQR